MRARLGWLGPAIVAVGLVVGGVGVWWMSRARPQAGTYVDVVAVADKGAVAIRAEAGGPRSFAELIELGGRVRWQALVPPYGGAPDAPGVVVTQRLVSVRVVRDGRPELFTLALDDALKVGGSYLAEDWPADAGGYRVPGLVSFDGVFHTYDVLGGAAGHRLVASSRTDGTTSWRFDSAQPITAAFERGLHLIVETGGARRALDAATGAPADEATAALATVAWPALTPGDLAAPGRIRAAALGDTAAQAALAVGPRLRFDAAARTLRIDDGPPRAWPPGALMPQPHHVGVGVLWLVWPDRVVAVDVRSLATRWTSDGKAWTWP